MLFLLVVAAGLGCRGEPTGAHYFDADTAADGEADGGGDADADSDSPDGADSDSPACSYPPGPYGFRTGMPVYPIRWTEAVIGADETRPADLAALHCDPETHSVFVYVTIQGCAGCAERLAAIAEQRDYWAEQGARWVFVVVDAATNADADAYVSGNGVTFGFRTNDNDNSEYPRVVGHADIFVGVPWVGVIRTADMMLVYDEPEDSDLDVVAIAAELAAGEG